MNKPRGQPFSPGNTLGRGRPKGSPNKAKAPGLEMLNQYSPHLLRKCISLAMQGDRSAMRMCMDRFLPARRDAAIRMSLPKIRTAQDLDQAAEQVTQAMRRGGITPTEAETIMNIFELRSRFIEKSQFEVRVEKLEASMATVNKLPRAA
jgi:hypothetical protein